MWIFTKSGFYSVCENKDNPELIHIRSQFRGDLEHLKEETEGFCKSEITETPFGDYRFRMDMTRAGWKNFMDKESDAIDYVKFKPAVKDRSESRIESYLTVFNEMMRAGRECAYAEYKAQQEREDI